MYHVSQYAIHRLRPPRPRGCIPPCHWPIVSSFHIPFASSTMYIGEFARLAGTTPKAVRLYEQLGLLPEPRRRGKYRVYRAEDLEWVGFIREVQ